MSYESKYEPAVKLGYGDLINIAYELQNGQPAWTMSDELHIPDLYVCANDKPQEEPFKVLHAGMVKLRQDLNGFWEPSLHAYGYASTKPSAVAVRVLGTLATDTMQELLGRNIHYLADRPELHERELSRIKRASAQEVRRPNVYAVLADLGLVEDPAPYLVH